MTEGGEEQIAHTMLEFGLGVLDVGEFEKWVYATDALESLFGEQISLALIEFDFRDRNGVWKLRQEICFNVLGLTEEEFVLLKGFVTCSRLIAGTMSAEDLDELLYGVGYHDGVTADDPTNPLARLRWELLWVEDVPLRVAMHEIKAAARSFSDDIRPLWQSVVKRVVHTRERERERPP